MESVNITIELTEYTFKYFFDTVTVGSNNNSPIFNVYTFIAVDPKHHEIVGEGFHILVDVTLPWESSFVFPIMNIALSDVGKLEKKIKEMLVEMIKEGL